MRVDNIIENLSAEKFRKYIIDFDKMQQKKRADINNVAKELVELATLRGVTISILFNDQQIITAYPDDLWGHVVDRYNCLLRKIYGSSK